MNLEIGEDKQGENEKIKKRDSDNNLLTMEDRVRASNENLEIIRVGDPE